MDEMEIDLKEYLDIIWSRKWLIIGITLLAALISGLISFFVLQPVYEASTTIMIGKSNTSEKSLQYVLDVCVQRKCGPHFRSIQGGRGKHRDRGAPFVRDRVEVLSCHAFLVPWVKGKPVGHRDRCTDDTALDHVKAEVGLRPLKPGVRFPCEFCV